MKSSLVLLMIILSIVSNGQNTGLGTSTPAAPLHIKSNTAFEMLRVEGNHPYISFFDNSQGYRGYLWDSGPSMELGSAFSSGLSVTIAPNNTPLAYFTTGGRVGVGVSNPSEKLDVNGNINLSGILRIDGNAGSAGQVLVSNGLASPTWQNTSFSNNIRFGISFDGAGSSGALPVSGTPYNLNSTAIVIGANSITINQTGLYHFNGTYSSLVSGPVAYIPELTFYMYVSGGSSFTYSFCTWKPMVSRTSVSNNYVHRDNFSVDFYIVAPSTIQLIRSIISSGATYSDGTAEIHGYLISQ